MGVTNFYGNSYLKASVRANGKSCVFAKTHARVFSVVGAVGATVYFSSLYIPLKSPLLTCRRIKKVSFLPLRKKKQET